MAIFSKALIATILLSRLALAAPLDARGYVTDIVTVTDYVTIDITDFIYLHEATTTAAGAETADTSTAAATTAIPEPTGTNQAAAVFTPAAVAPPASTSVPSMAFSATVLPTTPTPAPVTTPTSLAPDVSETAVSVQQQAVTGSTTATCEGPGAACVGDVTYWDGGLGACGTTVNTETDYAIALPFAFMGTLSNTNPYCNRMVTLYNPNSGTTIQAAVKDKCMGCVDRAIDCTNVLFNAITDGQGNGRYGGIVWWLD